LLSGLWHGAAGTFLLWGAWNGLFLVADRLFWLRLAERLPRPLSVAVTLLLVMVGWAIFRARGLSQLQEVLTAMVSPELVGQFVDVPAHQAAAIIIGFAGALLAATPPIQRAKAVMSVSPFCRAGAAIVVTMLGELALAKAITVTFNPFLYFRF
jgi:alginate O-acetyltransferase complex protein AlgI